MALVIDTQARIRGGIPFAESTKLVVLNEGVNGVIRAGHIHWTVGGRRKMIYERGARKSVHGPDVTSRWAIELTVTRRP